MHDDVKVPAGVVKDTASTVYSVTPLAVAELGTKSCRHFLRNQVGPNVDGGQAGFQ